MVRWTDHGRAPGDALRAPPTSFLGPVRPELLEVGPEIGDVLVVLDADECHAGARHFLHRCADIFVEGFLVPGDTGRFVGRGVVETLIGASLATLDAIGRRAELDFGVGPNVLAGGAKFPKTFL